MELDSRLMRLVGMARGFDVALATLGDALRAAQFEAHLDLERPSAAEVRLGLASRQLRLLSYLAGNPMFWKYPVAEYVLRPMVDTRIMIAWLIEKNDPELYEKFKSFGAGRLKLRKLHLEDFVEAEELDGEFEDHLAWLEARVNRETLEEFQEVDLGGNFAGRSIRDMAIESDLKRLYDLDYAPLSAEHHGEWQSLEEWDLAASGDPLHQGHLFGTFEETAEEGIAIQVVAHGFYLMADSVAQVFKSLEVDVVSELDACGEALTAAIARARKEAEAASEAEETPTGRGEDE
jgi:Family of unknown function (DUF5677)